MYVFQGRIILFLVLGFISAAKKRCLYEVLEVDRSVTKDEIRRSYRRLSMVYHPDKNSSPDAPDKFREIAHAYEVLADEEKRKVYDRRGHQGVEDLEQGGSGGEPMDPFDIFSSFFGSGGRRSNEKPTAAPLVFKLRLSLKQLYLGATLDVEYTRKVVCENIDNCTKRNSDCQAPGIKVVIQQLGPGFVVQNQVASPSCVDKGYEWDGNCKGCPKGATEPKTDSVEVDVRPGMEPGSNITFDGKGESRLGVLPGDLMFTISEIFDYNFRRNGSTLYSSIEITLLEALIGFEKSFHHLRGDVIVVKRHEVTHDRLIMTIRGEGMPVTNSYGSPLSYGDLQLTINVVYPRTLNEKTKELLIEALKT